MRRALDGTFVTPQPVFIIATYDANGNANAMNAAWAGQVGPKQIAVALSPHNTTENIKREQAFTVSFATKEKVAACDYVGMVSLNKAPDKMEKAGFTTVKSEKVNAPIIEQLPVTIECKVVDISTEFNETRVVGEIVGISADEAVLTDGKVDLDKMHPIMADFSGMCYREIGASVGRVFGAGKELM